MAKAVFVTYLIALSIFLASAYRKECAVGPQYWCQSFQNAQDCGAVRHCTDTVWRYDEKHTTVDSTTKCQWCQKILEHTHKGIQNLGANENLIKTNLIDGCKLLPLADISSKCNKVMENYGTSVLSLMKNQRYQTVCKLMDICSSETVSTEAPVTKASSDEESKMLCNVIVRATKDLHKNEKKSRQEIQTFLKDDCQKLSNQHLVQKCQDLVHRHATEIYAHVASNVELSKVCDYVGDFSQHSALTTGKSLPSFHCDLCQFVLATAQYMLDGKQSEDKVLSFVDEQVCERMTGESKKACQKLVLNDGNKLLESIKSGTTPLLTCTRFQVCLNQVVDPASPVQKDELRTFLGQRVCDQLGSLKDACYGLMEKDTTRVLQVLANDINGHELCRLFGLCPKSTPLLNEWNLKDDPAKCQRCVKDFTRRKHIAERLVNHSSEFLHHLCGQLPNESDCNKAIDESFDNLLTFIRSMDPQDICVQLHMCDSKNVKSLAVLPSDNVISEEILEYLKTDVCPKLDSLSTWCVQLVDTEGLALLDRTSKFMDPHRVCEILDVCPSSAGMNQCEDKCQCCTNKVQLYTLKLERFLKATVASTRTMCNFMPAHDVCIQLADLFESNVNKALTHLDSQKICQTLTFCSVSKPLSAQAQCNTCEKELIIRQHRFHTAVDEMTDGLLKQCNEDKCRALVKSTQQQSLNQIEKMNTKLLCQQMGYCVTDISSEPSPIQLRLRTLVQHQTQSLDQRLQAHDVCSEYGSLKTMCQHLLSSPQGHRYFHVYRAILQNNLKLVDDDLREQMSTKLNTDVCDACKNTVQSGKDFWINSLDTVRDVLLQLCERCPSKDQCRDYYNRQYESIKSYLNTIDANQFCQSLHLCSSASAPIQQGNECATCVARLDGRKQTLSQGIDRLTNYFSDICQRFELQPCQTFLKQLQQSLKTTIDSWNSNDICKQIGFCSSSSMKFDEYEKHLKEDLEQKICSQLGPFESLCRQILNGNREQVQTVKINYNIRDLMQLGQDRHQNLLSAANQNECANDRCQCCTDRIDSNKGYLKNVANQVFDALTKSCDYCPSKDQCRQYWTDSRKGCISSIDNIDSKQICTQLGFCTVSSLCAKMGLFQYQCEQVLTKYTQSLGENTKAIEENLPKTSVVILPTKKNDEKSRDSNATCILCEYLMHILGSYIHQKSTEEEIEKSLRQVCLQMPKPLQGQCNELVEDYAPVIIATLIREFDPSAVCHKLNICTKQITVNVNHLTKVNVAACGVCDYVSTYVHFALKRDSSEKSLKDALNSVCTHLSSEQKSQCEMLVQLFGPRIRDLQLNLGENFCQQLTICQTPKNNQIVTGVDATHIIGPIVDQRAKGDKSTKNNDKDVLLKNLDETPTCTLCHYVVSYLDAALKNNRSEAAIEAALAKVCTILPAKERPQCNELIKTYGPVLAELISEMADPDTICRYLGLCQVAQTVESTTKKQQLLGGGTHDYLHLPVQTTPFTCTICQFVISRMKQALALNQTEEEILASLKGSCDRFSVLNLQEQCKDFLDKYGPYLIQMVSSDIDPKVACQSIGVCEKKQLVVSSTNRPQSTPAAVSSSTRYGKCIFGMNYWCTSRQNAELCNAVELCEQQVWSKKNKNIII